MTTARKTRMIRELHSEPSTQFFVGLFTLLGLGNAADPAAEERAPRVQGAPELGSAS